MLIRIQTFFLEIVHNRKNMFENGNMENNTAVNNGVVGTFAAKLTPNNAYRVEKFQAET